MSVPQWDPTPLIQSSPVIGPVLAVLWFLLYAVELLYYSLLYAQMHDALGKGIVGVVGLAAGGISTAFTILAWICVGLFLLLVGGVVTVVLAMSFQRDNQAPT